MLVEIALATAILEVDKLPKSAKIKSFEVRRLKDGGLIAKDDASTIRQIARKLERIIPLGNSAQVITFALDGEQHIKCIETYVMKQTGAVKL